VPEDLKKVRARLPAKDFPLFLVSLPQPLAKSELKKVDLSDTTVSIISAMNNRHRETFRRIFENPVRSNVRWGDIESLLKALGAQISEGSGSRVRILLNDEEAVFHRPHPKPETDKGALKSMRRFLENAGATI
jgi:hypothetical protein